MLFFEELSLLKFGIPNKPFFDTLLYFLNSRQALDVCEKNFPIDESSVSFGYFNRSQHGLWESICKEYNTLVHWNVESVGTSCFGLDW